MRCRSKCLKDYAIVMSERPVSVVRARKGRRVPTFVRNPATDFRNGIAKYILYVGLIHKVEEFASFIKI